MQKFLASVGSGLLYAKRADELQFIANVKTLTESTLSFSSTMEEVRAGQGAKLYGRFNHDAGMTVTLTDAMFDLNYIALQVGAEIQRGGTTIHTEEVVATSEDWTGTAKPTLRVSKPIQKMGESCGFDHYLVWYREAGCNASTEYSSASPITEGGFVVQPDDIEIGKTYCVSYFTDDLSAKTVLINANFVPAELVLVLTTKLFAGDANAPETGKPVGEITIKVPRFQLDGTFDLSMAMSAAATMSLNGTALAVDAGGCEDEGIYAEIVEVDEGQKWYEGAISLYPDLDAVGGDHDVTPDDNIYSVSVASMEAGVSLIETYAVFASMSPQLIPVYYITVEKGDSEIAFDKYTGVITTLPANGDTITVKLNPEISDNEGAPESLTYTINFVE